MIDRTHALSVTRQAAALGISRGAVYYEPRATSAFDLALMRRIDVPRFSTRVNGSSPL
jgi:putative transposase